jgi:hypothetical protein
MIRTTILMLAAAVVAAAEGPRMAAQLQEADGAVLVTIDGQPFTRLVYRGQAKPVLYPIIGPGGVAMTRHWPMAEAVAGEEKDHPHHKSLWFTHGDVNGVDFWAEKKEAGTIVVKGKPETAVRSDGAAVVVTSEEWLAAGGKRICSSQTTVACGVEAGARFIDYAITITATDGPVKFGDTKEGTMGLRSHPALNLKGSVARGKCVNSEGEMGGAIWGRAAKWVDYSGEVEGKVLGIACFDHPGNLRHPTTWHARDYGLIAANPFGLSDFQKKPKGAGDHVIPAGEKLTLSYRWLFHEGDAVAADIAGRWQKWAGGKP